MPSQVTTILQIVGAAAILYGVLQIFSGVTELTEARKNHRGGGDNGEYWWTIVQGIVWAAFGTGCWTFLQPLVSAISFG